MTDILTRLKEATAASREMDAEVRSALDQVVIGALTPRYTSSIDASLALVERKLPKMTRITTMGDDDGLACYCRFVIFPNGLGNEDGKIDVKSYAATLPLAILQSLFLALQETDHADH